MIYQATPSIRRAIWKRDGGICGLCSTPVEFGRDMHIDRIDPKVRGYDDWSNLHSTHGVCNMRKGGTEQGCRGPNEDIRCTVNLSDELHDKIRDIARREHRSVNSQIVYALQVGIAVYSRRASNQEPSE